jgi:tRNA(fMet)-specific endonuclease VapC
MRYLLDTSICIYALKQHPLVIHRLLAEKRADVALSVITECELRTGAAKASAPTKTARLLENFLRPLTVVEFTSDDAHEYAAIRARLERAGTPIGPLDTLIGAQALARSLILVSNNKREFGRITGLRLDNWASQGSSV